MTLSKVLEKLKAINDRMPLASILAVLGTLYAGYAIVAQGVSLEEAFVQLGVFYAGCGVLGEARNRAGKGLNRWIQSRVERNGHL